MYAEKSNRIVGLLPIDKEADINDPLLEYTHGHLEIETPTSLAELDKNCDGKLSTIGRIKGSFVISSAGI
jgi:hypothetical protein